MVWNARILAEEEKHRQHHMDGKCSCGIIFPGEDAEERGRSREVKECIVQGGEYNGQGNGAAAPLLQGPGVVGSTFPTSLRMPQAGPIGIGYSYVPAIAPVALTDLPMAPISYSQAPGYTREWELQDGGAFRYFGYHIEQGNGSQTFTAVDAPGFGYNPENPTGMKWYPEATVPSSKPFARPDQAPHHALHHHVPRKGYTTHRNKHRGSKSSEPEVRGSKSTEPISTRSSSTEPERDACHGSEEFEWKEPVIVTSNMDGSS